MASTDGQFKWWNKRNNITFIKEYWEKGDADTLGAMNWLKEIWPGILETYSPCDIFNADEIGLFHKGFLDQGHCCQGDTGGKKKKRIPTLLCANMDGTKKKPLLIVGESKRPRCFPKDYKKLPVMYTHSQNAWCARACAHV